ncbi:MAG: ankyrin repeat domain-containing protein [Verrucomicrobiota bacterium]
MRAKILQFLSLSLLIVGMVVTTSCSNPQKVAEKTLNKNGYEFTPAGFVMAAGGGDLDAIKLFDQGLMDVNSADENGTTPLIAAAAAGRMDAVTQLLGMGADPRFLDKQGRDALISASGNGHVDVARLLLSRGGSFGHKDESGWNALSLAAFNGHDEVIKLLGGRADQPCIVNP